MFAPIVVEIDEDYTLPLCLFLHSLATCYEHNTEILRVIVVEQDMSLRAWRRVCTHAESLGVCVERRTLRPSMTPPLPKGSRLTSATYLRLLMLPVLGDLHRFVHLDVDLMIADSLDELLQLSPSPNGIAAVVDGWVPELGLGDVLPGWADLGLSSKREYFNAGVLVVDVDAVQEEGLFEEALLFAQRQPEHILWGDQDALNAVTNDRWTRLPYRWNTLQSSVSKWAASHTDGRERLPYSELVKAESIASILHFAGRRKPWAAGYPDGQLARRYAPVMANYREVEARLNK